MFHSKTQSQKFKKVAYLHILSVIITNKPKQNKLHIQNAGFVKIPLQTD